MVIASCMAETNPFFSHVPLFLRHNETMPQICNLTKHFQDRKQSLTNKFSDTMHHLKNIFGVCIINIRTRSPSNPITISITDSTVDVIIVVEKSH